MKKHDRIEWLKSITEGVQSFVDILHRLPCWETLDDSPFGVWADVNGLILCDYEADAERIADWLEGFDFIDCAITGTWDRAEDERNDTVDEYTGLWYVTID